MDLLKKIKILELEKGLVYEFTFEQYKAPLSKKISEFLQKEKEINIIYDFKLKSIKLIDKEVLIKPQKIRLINFCRI